MVIKEVTLYHVADGKHIITTKPMTLEKIRETLGPIQILERRGIRIVKAGKRVYEVPRKSSLAVGE